MSALLLLLAPLAAADEADTEEVDVTQEIVVWGDRFARWDNTRWFIETEVVQPWPLLLARDQNLEFETQEYRIRTIFACEKTHELSLRRQEVDCVIEDIGILANLANRRFNDERARNAQLVLDEIDGKLTGAAMQLRVADDGRVMGIEIEGIPTRNRRQNRIQQTLTQMMARLIVGFDLELQDGNQLHQGVWVEQNTKLLFLETQSQGSNYVKHYLDPYQGQIVVQSIGKGISTVEQMTSTSLSGDNVGRVGMRGQSLENRFKLRLDGVSLFDAREGYLIERVWAIEGRSNPAGTFVTLKYNHTGTVRVLGTQDRPDCGPSIIVNGRHQHWPQLPAYPLPGEEADSPRSPTE